MRVIGLSLDSASICLSGTCGTLWYLCRARTVNKDLWGLKPHGLHLLRGNNMGYRKKGWCSPWGVRLCPGWTKHITSTEGVKVLFDVLKTEGGGRKHHRGCPDSWHGNYSMDFRTVPLLQKPGRRVSRLQRPWMKTWTKRKWKGKTRHHIRCKHARSPCLSTPGPGCVRGPALVPAALLA